MKCDNIKLCKINILVSTFRTFDNRDKALICLPALLHNNAMCNLFAQYRKLHKFATTNSNFKKNQLFWTCIIIKHTCIPIFSKIGLKYKSRQSLMLHAI